MKDGSGTRLGIASVGKLNLSPVGLEAEREQALPTIGRIPPIARCRIGHALLLHSLEKVLWAFGFDNATGLAIEIKDVVSAATIEFFLTKYDGNIRCELEFGVCRSDTPPCHLQLLVDDFVGMGFQ
jgi:hypothetical protein